MSAFDELENVLLRSSASVTPSHFAPAHALLHSPYTNATSAIRRGAREKRAQVWMARITATQLLFFPELNGAPAVWVPSHRTRTEACACAPFDVQSFYPPTLSLLCMCTER